MRYLKEGSIQSNFNLPKAVEWMVDKAELTMTFENDGEVWGETIFYSWNLPSRMQQDLISIVRSQYGDNIGKSIQFEGKIPESVVIVSRDSSMKGNKANWRATTYAPMSVLGNPKKSITYVDKR